MYGILVSAAWTALSFLLRSVLVKFALFFGMFFVTTEFMTYLATKLPGVSALSSAMSGLDPGFWWFADMFGLSTGLPMIITAWVTRFCIRRIPVIG